MVNPKEISVKPVSFDSNNLEQIVLFKFEKCLIHYEIVLGISHLIPSLSTCVPEQKVSHNLNRLILCRTDGNE